MRFAVGSAVGPYEIVGVIGAGGMGEIYRARDTRLRREVAPPFEAIAVELAPLWV